MFRPLSKAFIRSWYSVLPVLEMSCQEPEELSTSYQLLMKAFDRGRNVKF